MVERRFRLTGRLLRLAGRDGRAGSTRQTELPAGWAGVGLRRGALVSVTCETSGLEGETHVALAASEWEQFHLALRGLTDALLSITSGRGPPSLLAYTNTRQVSDRHLRIWLANPARSEVQGGPECQISRGCRRHRWDTSKMGGSGMGPNGCHLCPNGR
jgi:hypothetical protein